MHVELVSPEGILFEGEATMVVARTLSGDIAFLQGHVPFIGSLAMHPVKIVMADGTTQIIAAHRGFIEVRRMNLAGDTNVLEHPGAPGRR